MKKVKTLIVLFSVLWLMTSCQESKQTKLDTPTGGSISITVDETLRPLLEAEEKAFEGLYGNANIRIIYASEAEAVSLLIKDSVRTAVLCRKLNDDEESFIQQVKIFPTTTKIGTDAITLIVHTENGDTVLSLDQLQKILTGDLLFWNELQMTERSSSNEIRIVFDHKYSSTFRYLKDSFSLTEQQPNLFALENNEKVIEYVSQNVNAVGIIGLSWISDNDDPFVEHSKTKIKVVAISNANETQPYPPYQAYLAQKLYPLSREIYVVSREARAGLGNGFTTFLANEIGQRVILKSGLLPATMPIRLVEVSSESLSYE